MKRTAGPRVAIIGGGISGLATAYYLSRQDASAEITVLEASPVWGGLLGSSRVEGFLLEKGPDSLVAQKPAALELCRDLGLENELVWSRSSHRKVWALLDGRLEPFPAGVFMKAPLDLSALLSSSLLSPEAKRLVQMETEVAPSGLEDESVAQFIGRRLGREVLDRIVEPLAGGVYGGDPDELSIRSTFPHLYRREQTHGHVGSMTVMAKSSSGSKSPFVSLSGGLGRLVESLTAFLVSQSVRLWADTPVSGISRDRRGTFVLTHREQAFSADCVVIATTAPSAALLLAEWPSVAAPLYSVRYSRSIIANLGFNGDVTRGLQGTGFLIPRSEKLNLFACTWVHHKFPGRCPPRSSLLRCFVGTDKYDALDGLPDAEIIELLQRELEAILGFHKEPQVSAVERWKRALPLYSVGHHAEMKRFEHALCDERDLYCVGNYLDGVGISDCIRHARRVAFAICEDRQGLQTS